MVIESMLCFSPYVNPRELWVKGKLRFKLVLNTLDIK